MLITIFTPTYNRAYTLERLYKSLTSQNKKKFEWIILDDGSTDNTRALAEQFILEKKIFIKYFYQENFGKHVAINKGAQLSSTEWFFIIDSDDYLTEDAILKIDKRLQEVSNKFNVAGLCFRKADNKHNIMGNIFARAEWIITSPNLANKMFNGDLAYIFKTTLIRKNIFPNFYNEKFVPELYLWNILSKFGEIHYHTTDYIYICEYLPDGYTNNFKENLKKNPIGFLVFYLSQIKESDELISKIKSAIRSLQCIYFYLVKNRNL